MAIISFPGMGQSTPQIDLFDNDRCFNHTLSFINIHQQGPPGFSKYLDLKPKLIKCHLCNYLIWLPFPKWANMTSLQWGWRGRHSLLMNCTSQLPRFTGCVCEELSNTQKNSSQFVSYSELWDTLLSYILNAFVRFLIHITVCQHYRPLLIIHSSSVLALTT